MNKQEFIISALFSTFRLLLSCQFFLLIVIFAHESLITLFLIPLLRFLDMYMLRFLISISRSLSQKAAPVYITVLDCTGKSLFYMALLAWKNITAVYAHRCALELFYQFLTLYALPPM